MQFPRKPRRAPALNIIPLIDVLVVLLIFYIATTVFKKVQHKLDIVIPQSKNVTNAPDTQPSTIYVTKDNTVYLDDQLVDPDLLGDMLKNKKAADPNYKVFLKSDGKVTFDMIVKIMDAARDAGIDNLQTYATPAPAPGSDAGGAAPAPAPTP
jgi:biopolymer transport protein ExbD